MLPGPGPAPPGPGPPPSPPLSDETLLLVDVWAHNLDEEMAAIAEVVETHPYIAMDTEFPGVARPLGSFKTPGERAYASLRCNVDMLKLIQLGLTFTTPSGALPVRGGRLVAWQFNFREFSLDEDMYAADSIALLRTSGIDFGACAERGIDVRRFGELLMTSGVVLSDDAIWVTFHSSYDFGYLLKLATCCPLPPSEAEFEELLRLFFPTVYDIKYIMKHLEGGLHGGLQRLADALEVGRVGPQHQAGSDALLTARVFFELRRRFFPQGGLERHANVLYGLGADGRAADEEGAAVDA